MRAATLWIALGLFALACTTTYELGERRYREGDRLAALEIWRSVDRDSPHYERAQRRIGEVEAEFRQLVIRYQQRARYFERKDRLAEAVLSWRLAAELAPEDGVAMERAQSLARTLAARRAEGLARLRAASAAGDRATAAKELEALRALDPFDPEVAAEAQRFDAALRADVEDRLARGRERIAAGDRAGATRAFRSVLEIDPGNDSAQGYLAYLAQPRPGEETPPRVAARPPAPKPAPRPGGASSTPPGAPARPAHPTPSSPAPPPAAASETQIRAEGLHQNALAAARRGDPYLAIRYEQRALAIDPGNEGARKHLAALRAKLAPQVDELIESGRVAFMQEDLQGALDQWRRALLIDPQSERAQSYVGRAEKLLENLEQLRADDGAAAP